MGGWKTPTLFDLSTGEGISFAGLWTDQNFGDLFDSHEPGVSQRTTFGIPGDCCKNITPGIAKVIPGVMFLLYREILDPPTAFEDIIAKNALENISGDGDTGNHQNA